MNTDDEEYYLQATFEVESSGRREALWAKSMALSNGDLEGAKYQYIKLRVAQLSRGSVDSIDKDLSIDVRLDEFPSEPTNINNEQKDVGLNKPNRDVVGKWDHNQLWNSKTHSFTRRALGVLTFLIGLGFLFMGFIILFNSNGESLTVILVLLVVLWSCAICPIVGGWKELTATGYAGLGTGVTGLLLILGQLYLLFEFMEENKLAVNDLFQVPLYFQLYGPGLFVCLLSLVLMYIGFTGSDRKNTIKRSREFPI